jgi:hypothetical protein
MPLHLQQVCSEVPPEVVEQSVWRADLPSAHDRFATENSSVCSIDPPSEAPSTLEYAVIIRQFYDADYRNNGKRGRSREPLPRGLPGDAQGGADLRPTDLARSKKVDHRLELIALALHRLLDRPQSLQQTFCRQLFR